MLLSDYRYLRSTVENLHPESPQYPLPKLHSCLARAINEKLGPVETLSFDQFVEAVKKHPSHHNWKSLVRIMAPSLFQKKSARTLSSPRKLNSSSIIVPGQLRTNKYIRHSIPDSATVTRIRRKSQKLAEKLPDIFNKLSTKGIDVRALKTILSRPYLLAMDHNRNFNIGLTVTQNTELQTRNDEFLCIWRRFDIRCKASHHDRELMAIVKLEMMRELKSHLSGRVLQAALRNLKLAESDNLFKVFKGCLFFGMFRDLLDLNYLGTKSPFSKDAAFLRHVIRHVDPSIYLTTIAMDPEKHEWKEIIKNLYELLSPHMERRRDINSEITQLLYHKFYTVFESNKLIDDQKQLAEKVRQITRKLPPPKTKS